MDSNTQQTIIVTCAAGFIGCADSAVWVDNQQWGYIGGWKDRYDTSIENTLKGHEEDHALIAL